jgi:hypothetical protein
MAELILTEAEKQTNSWLDLDNESIGKVAKALSLRIKESDEKSERLHMMSAAIILVGIAQEANADRLKFTLEDIMVHGKNTGNWTVTIKKEK